MIEVVNLVKRYKELLALDHFNLEVKDGEIFGLLGPNGSGKTTLINCILSLLTYDKGEIKVFGEKLTPNSYELKKKIGLVPQELAIFENLTVYENIDYFCGLYVEDSKKRKELVEEAIDFVDLNDYRKFTPKKLSGGLKRRLNIACGIAHKPDLIFLDEPTVAVDAQSRNFMLEGVKKLNRDGATIVYTSHYLEEVEAIAKRVAIMDKGRNLVEGTTADLKKMVSVKEKINIKLMGEHDIEQDLKDLSNVSQVDREDETYSISFAKTGNNIEHVFKLLRDREINYTEINVLKPTLNDVFLELTGKELRD
ncbi:MAG: ABC transporter ATP-binding protein [Tissierellia bacterium]|nr:ABC transporter ATP-binding protein [Tissierellia bacterium]